MTLKLKFAVGSVVLTGVAVAVISVFSSHLVARASQQDLENKAVLLAQNLIAQHSGDIQRRDEARLLQGLLDAMKDPVVVYGMVLDPDGKVVAHTDVAQVGLVHKDLAEQARACGADVLTAPMTASGRPIMDVMAKARVKEVAPSAEAFFVGQADDGGEKAAEQKMVGILHLGLDMRPALNFTRNIRRGMILIAVSTLAFMFVFSSAFAMIITRPIKQLMFGITELQNGNLSASVDIQSHDEIGRVGKAFNLMVRIISKAQDELKTRAEQLARANKDLQESHDKVVRSEKLAAIGQLASGVGHELRNPLGAIRNAIYYLKDAIKGSALAEQDPATLEFLGLADKEIQSATSIITDLLDFARVPKLILQPLDVNALLLEVKRTMEIPEQVKVSEDLAKDLPRPQADRDKMMQVFRNLVQNAVQAMPKGGELHIVTRAPADPVSPIVVEVKDSGVGISPENLAKVFEPLFTTKAKGTGLGLPISRGIVEKHGGHLSAVSVQGQGTTFTVTIPVGVPAT